MKGSIFSLICVVICFTGTSCSFCNRDQRNVSFQRSDQVSFRLSSQSSNDNVRYDDHRKKQLPIPKAPIWTTVEIRRRETERRLLSNLLQGDDAINQLRNLWFSERGNEVEALMYQAEFGIGHPQNWTLAETILQDLILADPTYLEPFARLSKLYCLQGRFQESHDMCRRVLEQRPWHYVALETMVAVLLVKDDNRQLLLWAKKRLPPPSQHKLRRTWVEQAIEDSKRIQKEAENHQIENVDDSSWQ